MTGSNNITDSSQSGLEQIRQIDQDGREFWTARKLTPVLGYASWQRVSAVYEDVYSSFCLENPSQTEMTRSWVTVRIGSGALRTVKDWKLSRFAVHRVLSRVAGHKPEAVRQLRNQSRAQMRIEIDIGAVLLDFCDAASLSLTHQKELGEYRFDYCIDEQILVEIDEAHHRMQPCQKRRDQIKTALCRRHGYKLLRIQIPVENTANLCGQLVRLLIDGEHLASQVSQRRTHPIHGGARRVEGRK